jgi:hypothetical protein
MTFFTQEKGTLLPEKGHLANLGAGLGSPAPPVPTPLKLFNIELFIVYRVRTKLESSGGNLGWRAAATPPSRKSDEFSEILT